ncbi:MAG: DUF2726 domain-containing protein, partial [Ostreibacterium sp.]
WIIALLTGIIVITIIVVIGLFGKQFKKDSTEVFKKDSTEAPKKNRSKVFSYHAINLLFTPAERAFLSALELAIADKAYIFAKVRVADILKPQKGLSRSDWQVAFNKISSKHVDYVICSKDEVAILCVIELNDKSHDKKERRARDKFLARACGSASVPLYFIPVQRSYSSQEIKDLLSQYIPEIASTPAKSTTKNVVETAQAKVSEPKDKKTCPKCSAELVLRTAKKGKNIGRQFWGCSTFPTCRYLHVKSATES